MLEIKNLKKHFGGVKAVNDCSFDVKENTVTALIGPNGSGKTTVFNLISGLIKEDQGKIYFNEKDITNLASHEVSNSGISRLFQKSRLFENLSVRDNLLLALYEEDQNFIKNLIRKNKISKEKEEKVKQALKKVELEDYLNKNSGDLSYGQKRLVEISRTILKPHKLVMLDEPVAGVNPKLRKKISKTIQELKKKGDTILLIEHDINFTLSIADYIIVMDHGKVIAQGKPDEIRKNKKVLEAYFGD